MSNSVNPGTAAHQACLSFTISWSEVKWKFLSHVWLPPCGLYSPWNSLGQNTGVGSLPFLQGFFPAQGSNPGLLHCRGILYQLSHKGNPLLFDLRPNYGGGKEDISELLQKVPFMDCCSQETKKHKPAIRPLVSYCLAFATYTPHRGVYVILTL